MNQNQKIRELQEKNMQQANSILSRGALAFLILCPVIVLVCRSGIMTMSLGEMAGVCGLIAVLSLIPFLGSQRIFNEEMFRDLTLSCIEAIVCIIGLNPIINVSMLYLLVPMISVIYLKKATFLKIARNCFFAMLMVELIRFFGFADWSTITTENVFSVAYEEFVPLLLGYVLIMLVVYFIFDWLGGFVVSVAVMQAEPDPSKTVKQVKAPNAAEEKDSLYNVKGLFLEINQQVQGLIRGKDKALSVNVDYDLPITLKGKPDRIKLALVNVLSDFLQYTEQGTVTLSVTYEKGITPRKGQNITLICRVLCSEDLTEKIHEGSAMGVALGKSLIESMNGIILDKTFGRAVRQTCYTISLLQEVADEETLIMVKEKNRSEQEALVSHSRKKEQNILAGRKAKALIVDDSKENRRLVKSILKNLGVEADLAASGQEAIELIESKAYDFAIIDHMMPGKGGIQTAKEIRQMEDAYFELVPLMVMSSNVTEDSRSMFTECGFSEIISKPIKEEELRLAISRIFLS